jgi:hypothetical protein
MVCQDLVTDDNRGIRKKATQIQTCLAGPASPDRATDVHIAQEPTAPAVVQPQGNLLDLMVTTPSCIA